jgi:hypothetical protein
MGGFLLERWVGSRTQGLQYRHGQGIAMAELLLGGTGEDLGDAHDVGARGMRGQWQAREHKTWHKPVTATRSHS